MAPFTIQPPSADNPKGLAWLLGVGFVDPRPGNYPNQPGAVIQSWEGTAQLYWDLGIRWHPERATKWATGGGQFHTSTIVNEKPEDFGKEQTMEQRAEDILEFLGTENPEYVALLKKIREAGSDKERAEIAKQYEGEIKKLIVLTQYIQSKE